MVRRKVQLLDLLREQKERRDTGAPKRAAPRPEPRPRTPREPFFSKFRVPRVTLPRFQIPALESVPWVAVGLVSVLVIPLIWWMASRFGGEPEQNAGRPEGPGSPVLSATTGRQGGGGEAAPIRTGWRILAITYNHSEANLSLAATTAIALEEAEFPEVLLVEKPPGQPRWIQLFVGLASSREALRPLLQSLHGVILSGDRPFTTASVVAGPDLVAND